jgi:two-component system cell cycle response regulator DivK
MGTILYVEHNAEDAQGVKEVLDALRYKFIWAENGQQGLALAEAHHADVVLLNLELPDMSADDFIHRLRANFQQRLLTAPIVAVLSGGGAEQALAARCDGYLFKPIRQRDIWVRVEAILHEHAFVRETLRFAWAKLGPAELPRPASQ